LGPPRHRNPFLLPGIGRRLAAGLGDYGKLQIAADPDPDMPIIFFITGHGTRCRTFRAISQGGWKVPHEPQPIDDEALLRPLFTAFSRTEKAKARNEAEVKALHGVRVYAHAARWRGQCCSLFPVCEANRSGWKLGISGSRSEGASLAGF